MTKDQLTRYAAAAWTGINGDHQIAFSVRPQPGLELVLSRQESEMKLKAIREEHPLELNDASIIAEAFGVPLAAEPALSQRRATQRVRGREITEHVVTWVWQEIPT